MTRLALRLAGAALAVAAALALLVVLLFAFGSAEAPDPFLSAADPCCGHPDAWGEVWAGAGLVVGAAVVVGLPLAGGIALLAQASRRRRPGFRRLAAVPLAAGGLAAAAFAVPLLPELDDGPAYCDAFRFSRPQWIAQRQSMALGIAKRGTVDGRTAAQVRTMLGEPQDQLGEMCCTRCRGCASRTAG